MLESSGAVQYLVKANMSGFISSSPVIENLIFTVKHICCGR